ncbi:peptidase M20 superfamily [Streptococcus pneumoniae]|nr:peptidase M20 superfamily [Streptococcus pneumoniae]
MIAIDFTAEVEKRKEDLLADLFSLLEINSERDDSKADAQHPFGPGPVKALEKFLEIADRDGYPTKNVDNYAGHFEFGDGEEVLGIFAHMDVVPAGSGWDTDPYTPTIKDGRLYARGASDDKGPTTACYYGLKIIKELGLPTSKKVRFIVGTDEESGWADMDYSSMVKKETSRNTSTLQVKIQVQPVFTALQVVYVKIWYQNQQQQSFQVT